MHGHKEMNWGVGALNCEGGNGGMGCQNCWVRCGNGSVRCLALRCMLLPLKSHRQESFSTHPPSALLHLGACCKKPVPLLLSLEHILRF